MKFPRGRRVPRAVAIVVPPVCAILGAWLYTGSQLRTAEREVSEFCARVEPGVLIPEFVQRALEKKFTVTDGGADSFAVTASTVVYGLHQEVFNCTARHDGTQVVSTATRHTRE